MKLLDLFSGAGGAARGYMNAGFHVTGVDYHKQPRYAGDKFIYADVYEWTSEHAHEYDIIHASPPCQRYSTMAGRTGRGYPDSVARTRGLLQATGKPWVIENVPEAPLVDPIVLCGTHFDLCAQTDGGRRWLRRHRHFESSHELHEPAVGCDCDVLPIGGVYGNGGGGEQTRGYKFTSAQAREAMEIDWMTRRELSQAVPPAYTTFIGFQLNGRWKSLWPPGEKPGGRGEKDQTQALVRPGDPCSPSA
jgi:DNA (cytosine-5)-methyltransferase 1